MKRPLEGILVLEFCQFLAGPSAGLRLADLGARVIKIERPVKGDACRQLAIKNLFIEEDSLLFHTINRNKDSYAADLKNPEDLKLLEETDCQSRCDDPQFQARCNGKDRTGLPVGTAHQS